MNKNEIRTIINKTYLENFLKFIDKMEEKSKYTDRQVIELKKFSELSFIIEKKYDELIFEVPTYNKNNVSYKRHELRRKMINEFINKMVYYMYINKIREEYNDKETLIYFRNNYLSVNGKHIDDTYVIKFRKEFLNEEEIGRFNEIFDEIDRKVPFTTRWFDYINHDILYLYTKVFFEDVSDELIKLIELYINSLIRYNKEKINGGVQ